MTWCSSFWGTWTALNSVSTSLWRRRQKGSYCFWMCATKRRQWIPRSSSQCPEKPHTPTNIPAFDPSCSTRMMDQILVDWCITGYGTRPGRGFDYSQNGKHMVTDQKHHSRVSRVCWWAKNNRNDGDKVAHLYGSKLPQVIQRVSWSFGVTDEERQTTRNRQEVSNRQDLGPCQHRVGAWFTLGIIDSCDHCLSNSLYPYADGITDFCTVGRAPVCVS